MDGPTRQLEQRNLQPVIRRLWQAITSAAVLVRPCGFRADRS
ncbi:hypothetical protein ACGF8B_24370 [Streptomyces sp. NPDC047917]